MRVFAFLASAFVPATNPENDVDELNQGTEGTTQQQGDTAAQEGGATSAGENTSSLGAAESGNSSTSATLTGGEAGNASPTSTLAGGSTAAELPADTSAPLVPNAPVSGAADLSAQSISGTATDASGVTAGAALGAEAETPAARHPAHTWLDVLEAELKTNPFATYARELIAKVRAAL